MTRAEFQAKVLALATKINNPFQDEQASQVKTLVHDVVDKVWQAASSPRNAQLQDSEQFRAHFQPFSGAVALALGIPGPGKKITRKSSLGLSKPGHVCDDVIQVNSDGLVTMAMAWCTREDDKNDYCSASWVLGQKILNHNKTSIVEDGVIRKETLIDTGLQRVYGEFDPSTLQADLDKCDEASDPTSTAHYYNKNIRTENGMHCSISGKTLEDASRFRGKVSARCTMSDRKICEAVYDGEADATLTISTAPNLDEISSGAQSNVLRRSPVSIRRNRILGDLQQAMTTNCI